MAEHNTSIEVGAAQSIGASYAPRRTNITTSTSNWNYGYGSYPAPYRSFSQNLVNANWILGPYCRRLDGVAGRIKISTQAEFGELGFAQQCWYDFPRGANDKINGVLQSTNKVWWDTEVSRKWWIRVYNLNDDNAPLIWVQVAIDGLTGSDGTVPALSMHDPSNGPLNGDCIRYIRAAHNLHGGQVNPLQLYTGIAGNCGIKSDTLSALAIPYQADSGGWLPDVSFLENGGMSGCPWALDPNGEAEDELGNIYNSLNGTERTAAGASFSDANRANNLLGWISTHLGNVKDFLEDLRSWAYTEAANETADRNAAIKQTLELLSAAPMAAELMIHGWFLPNLRKYGSGNGVTGTASNPYKWRPPNHVQQRFASYLLDNGTTGAPFGGGTDFKAYIPGTTPNKKDDDGNTTSESDWGWYLTLLNRGDTTTVPYVDPATNEFVFAENYGFNRGGSVQSADPFLNWVDNNFGTQTGDSIGTLLDMSPAAPFFIVTVIPIVALEVGGQLIKAKKGESIGSGGNLDGYDDTKFEIRISARNLKEGNLTMYNYLVSTGDANGNKFTAVP